jgi:hypothetical protein
VEYRVIDPEEETKKVRRSLAIEAFRELVAADIELGRRKRVMALKGPAFAEVRKSAREHHAEAQQQFDDAKQIFAIRSKGAEVTDEEYRTAKKGLLEDWVRSLELQHVQMDEERKGLKGEERATLDTNAAIIETAHAFAIKELQRVDT